MLVTQQPVLRRFWYPVVPSANLSCGNLQSFELLGQKIVLWLDANSQPAAIAAGCCHRSAQLSLGVLINGYVRCPYHGWSFDREGQCVNVPQLPSQVIPASYKVQSYQCTERYGYT